MNQSDNVTFRLNFAGDGVAKLRDRVKDKLKEFMGDYTDDTLVEYVIVLLKNGRRKVEARNELNVFLGDDSDSFVSWLWEHLEKNLDLYVQTRDAVLNVVTRTNSTSKEQAEKIDSRPLDYEHEKERPNKVSRSRRGREWKGLVKNADEAPPLRSIVTANIHVDEDTHKKADYPKRSPSPRPVLERKRRHPDERLQMKKNEVSKITINAPRRLLQFAVRDAVGSPRSSTLSAEPSSKRLRSVVSISAGDSSLGDRFQIIESVARVPNATMAVAIEAVAEAAKDVVKVRSSGNVFDRLGRATDVLSTSDPMDTSIEAHAKAVEEYSGFDYISQKSRSTHLQGNDFDASYFRNGTGLGSYAGIASIVASDNELYEDHHIMARNAMGVSHSGTLGANKVEDSLTMHYSVAGKAYESTPKARKGQNHSAATHTSAGELSAVSSQKIIQGSEAGAGQPGGQPMKENNHPVSVGNGNPAADGQWESQKPLLSTAGLYTGGCLVEDANLRTIFVSNVHFAASKDSLSRHFNKFGDVLKVVIVTDAATGQPKGSAYVEFMRREAAEHALSLDGTSFLSRILKVVMKSAAPQEVAPVMTWPRISRGSMFAASRFGRVPFPRGILSSYRPWPPVKAGARSLQWKRDTKMATETPSVSNNNIPSPTTRGLTYVRAEPKTNGYSSTA